MAVRLIQWLRPTFVDGSQRWAGQVENVPARHLRPLTRGLDYEYADDVGEPGEPTPAQPPPAPTPDAPHTHPLEPHTHPDSPRLDDLEADIAELAKVLERLLPPGPRLKLSASLRGRLSS